MKRYTNFADWKKAGDDKVRTSSTAYLKRVSNPDNPNAWNSEYRRKAKAELRKRGVGSTSSRPVQRRRSTAFNPMRGFNFRI